MAARCRRVLVLCLLLLGLGLVAAPAVIALNALLRGDAELAWRVFGPVLLVPAGLLAFGVVRSFRGRSVGVARRRPPR